MGPERCSDLPLMISELCTALEQRQMKDRRGSRDFKHRNLTEMKYILQVLEPQQSLGKMSSEKGNPAGVLITGWRAYSPDDLPLNSSIKHSSVFTIQQQHSCIICLRNEYGWIFPSGKSCFLISKLQCLLLKNDTANGVQLDTMLSINYHLAEIHSFPTR